MEAARQAAAVAARQASAQAVVQRLQWVAQAIRAQEYYRLNVQDDLVRRQQLENECRNELDRRYRFKKQ